jgi:thioredoxin-like negative regulator of GroEL
MTNRPDSGPASEVLPRQPGLGVVHFRADDCDACDHVADVLGQLVHAGAGPLPLTEIDVNDRPVLAARYDVRVTPTILLLRDGVIVDRVVGGATRLLLQSLLDARAPRRAAA